MLGDGRPRDGLPLAVLDPDPACPAAAVADAVVVAPYDDIEAALRLAQMSDVVTYELEPYRATRFTRWPTSRIQPDPFALAMTQDRLAERRFLSSIGVPTAEWREVPPSRTSMRAWRLGAPLRLKASRGGYDGRSQVRIADPGTTAVEEAWRALGARAAEGLLLEREVAFEQEVSVVIGRDLAGRSVPYPVVRNRHDTGILVELIAPAPGPREIVPAAFALAEKIATALAAVGVITESFRCRTARSSSTNWRPECTTAVTGRSKARVRASSPSTSGQSAGCRLAPWRWCRAGQRW